MNSITYDKCWHIINHVTRLLGFRFIDNVYFGMIFPDRIACFLFDCLFCFKIVLLNIFSFIFCGTYSLKGVPSCEPELYEIELLQYIWQTTRSSFFFVYIIWLPWPCLPYLSSNVMLPNYKTVKMSTFLSLPILHNPKLMYIPDF